MVSFPAEPASRPSRARAALLGWATPVTTGLFTVSAVSGVALFFRWAPSAFHAMHEWLSLALLLPFAFHVWRNWTSLVAYLRRGRLLLPFAASLLVALPFAWPALTGTSRGSPGARAVRALTAAPLATVAPVLGTTPDALVSALKARGYAVAAATDTLEGIAAASRVPASQILMENLPR